MYWFFIPTHKRNMCLFKESCSSIVFRVAKEEGFLQSIKMLRTRTKACNPSYEVLVGETFEGLVTNNRIEIPFNDLSISMQEKINFYKNLITVK